MNLFLKWGYTPSPTLELLDSVPDYESIIEPVVADTLSHYALNYQMKAAMLNFTNKWLEMASGRWLSINSNDFKPLKRKDISWPSESMTKRIVNTIIKLQHFIRDHARIQILQLWLHLLQSLRSINTFLNIAHFCDIPVSDIFIQSKLAVLLSGNSTKQYELQFR